MAWCELTIMFRNDPKPGLETVMEATRIMKTRNCDYNMALKLVKSGTRKRQFKVNLVQRRPAKDRQTADQPSSSRYGLKMKIEKCQAYIT